MESSCAWYFCLSILWERFFRHRSADPSAPTGFSLLRNAGYEAQQHDADTPLIRSLFVTGLLYSFEAIPADLSGAETSAIRGKIPTRIQSSVLHSCRSEHTLYIEDGQGMANTDQPCRPSLIHRILPLASFNFASFFSPSYLIS